MTNPTRRRVERWTIAVSVVLAAASIAPTVYLLSERHRDTLVPWLEDLGGWSSDTESELSLAETGAYTIGLPVLLACLGGFSLLIWLRRRNTLRSIERGDALSRRSSVVARLLTAAACLVLMAGLGLLATLVIAAGPANTSNEADRFVDNPAWMLLTLGGLIFTVAASLWFHRHAYGLRVWAEPTTSGTPGRRPGGGPVRLDEGLRNYGRSMVVEAGFGIAGLLRLLVGPDDLAIMDYWVEWVVFAIAAPAMLSGMFMVVLWVRPTRWIVIDAFRQPLTKVALGSMAAGVVMVSVGSNDSIVTVIGVVLTMGGALVAGVTGLYLQDVGPQPQLAIVFIGLLYVANAFTTESGHIGLPGDVYSWVAAAALLFFVVREVRGLWRKYYRRADPSPPRLHDRSV